jgi:hypothetical protein
MPLVTLLLASSEQARETNGILECKFLPENAHRAKLAWLFLYNEFRVMKVPSFSITPEYLKP